MPPAKGPKDGLAVIAGIDRAVHAPARLMILALLSAVDSVDFTFLLNQTGLTRGNLSTHLQKLEQSAYIEVNKEFVDRIPRTLIHLTKEGCKAIEAYREDMRLVVDDLLA
jgi:DNA-binding MarR family transcriptional regulator